jgi:hypothetical protein
VFALCVGSTAVSKSSDGQNPSTDSKGNGTQTIKACPMIRMRRQEFDDAGAFTLFG